MLVKRKQEIIPVVFLILAVLACGKSVNQSNHSASVPSKPPFTLIPFNYVVEDVGDGWNEGWIALAVMNTSGQLLDPLQIPSLSALAVSIETEEGQSYSGELVEVPGNVSSLDLDGLDVNESNILPVPPCLVYWTTRSDYTYSGYLETRNQISRYWIRFRFAYAAHPTKVRIQFSPSGYVTNANPEFVIELSSVTQNLPTYQPNDIKPISALQQVLNRDIAKLNFRVDSTCVIRYGYNGKEGWHMYLPYYAANQDQFNQENAKVEFGYALWFPYGAWNAHWVTLNLQLGPAQQVQDELELASWESTAEPMPTYLILYEPIGTYGVYQTASTYSIQCQER